jgi:hypothetical protein
VAVTVSKKDDPAPTKGLAHLKVVVRQLLDLWPGVLRRQLYLQAMGRSVELREALNQTYAAHVHNTLQTVLVVDLIREIGALVLDADSRSASVRRAVAGLRDGETLKELEQQYHIVQPIKGADEATAAAVHEITLKENLEQFDSIPELLKTIDKELLTGQTADTITTVRNKSIAHYDVAHDGKDWKMWRIEDAGLTYGQLDEYINVCTRAVNTLSSVVLSASFYFADLPGISKQQTDEYIGALTLGLNKQREIKEAERSSRLAELRAELANDCGASRVSGASTHRRGLWGRVLARWRRLL